MSQSIAHRGPDGDGLFESPGIILGHRRLSILELTNAGSQPMLSGNGQIAVAFNGEIFNFRELRQELMLRGHQFRGRSDTEVILAAYAEWGIGGLERLEGMFAIAVWDTEKSTLMLVRDRIGIKPLFYGVVSNAIAFGSEIKAVLASELVSERIDPQAFSEYLWFGNPHGERTIYSDIRVLEPGCRLIWNADGLRIERWWAIEHWLDVPESRAVRANPIDAIRGSIDVAVRRQLVADVPVGLLLSGGLDSSAIAASVAHAPTRQDVRSFTATFGGLGITDEREKAQRVADALGLDNDTINVGALNIQDAVLRLVDAHDEPFADAANIALYAIAKSISSTMKVVLQGDGGDELFGGYRRYLLLRHRALLRLIPHWVLDTQLFTMHPVIRRLDRVAMALNSNDPAMQMALLLTTDTTRSATIDYFDDDMVRRLRRESDPFLAYRSAAARFSAHDLLTQMFLTDLTVQLPSQFLTKVDRSTMANGVEARVPLLDEVVCKTALNLPVELKVRGLRRKIGLRAALRQRIPDEILEAPKTGFGVPYKQWLTGPLWHCAEAALLSADFGERFHVDRDQLVANLARARSGGDFDGYQLWKLTQLALWARARPHAFI